MEVVSKRVKPDTNWYNDLILLYRKAKELELPAVYSALRNIGWDCMKGLVHGRVHEHIRKRKLLVNRDLCQKLFQESFFIYIKATDIWDPGRGTKFLTFLGDILDQELMNIVRMDNWYRTRDKKLEYKLRSQVISESEEFPDEESKEKEMVLEEIKELLEKFSFDSRLERNIVNTIIYGKSGDWTKLRKESGVSSIKFSKIRKEIIEKLKKYILEGSSTRVKDLLHDIVTEK